MFRVVLPLPYKILIVARKVFTTQEDAEQHWYSHYRNFPAFEVWDQGKVDKHQGLVYLVGKE